jgi:hypothetical protein
MHLSCSAICSSSTSMPRLQRREEQQRLSCLPAPAASGIPRAPLGRAAPSLAATAARREQPPRAGARGQALACSTPSRSPPGTVRPARSRCPRRTTRAAAPRRPRWRGPPQAGPRRRRPARAGWGGPQGGVRGAAARRAMGPAVLCAPSAGHSGRVDTHPGDEGQSRPAPGSSGEGSCTRGARGMCWGGWRPAAAGSACLLAQRRAQMGGAAGWTPAAGRLKACVDERS